MQLKSKWKVMCTLIALLPVIFSFRISTPPPDTPYVLIDFSDFDGTTGYVLEPEILQELQDRYPYVFDPVSNYDNGAADYGLVNLLTGQPVDNIALEKQLFPETPDFQGVFFFREDIGFTNPYVIDNGIQLINSLRSRAASLIDDHGFNTDERLEHQFFFNMYSRYYFPLNLNADIGRWIAHTYDNRGVFIRKQHISYQDISVVDGTYTILSENSSVSDADEINVLVCQINFPVNENSYTEITPPVPIMPFNQDGYLRQAELNSGEDAYIGNGIVTNVDNFHEIRVRLIGLETNNRMSIRLMDEEGNIHEFFLGYIQPYENENISVNTQSGQQSVQACQYTNLRWVNGDYNRVISSNNRIVDRNGSVVLNPEDLYNEAEYQTVVYPWEVERLPIYPRELTFYTFHSFVIYNNLSTAGKEVGVILKDISIRYTSNISNDEEEIMEQDIRIWERPDDENSQIMLQAGKDYRRNLIFRVVQAIYQNYFNQYHSIE